jgi:hypothetical protein
MVQLKRKEKGKKRKKRKKIDACLPWQTMSEQASSTPSHGTRRPQH